MLVRYWHWRFLVISSFFLLNLLSMAGNGAWLATPQQEGVVGALFLGAAAEGCLLTTGASFTIFVTSKIYYCFNEWLLQMLPVDQHRILDAFCFLWRTYEGCLYKYTHQGYHSLSPCIFLMTVREDKQLDGLCPDCKGSWSYSYINSHYNTKCCTYVSLERSR